MSTTRVRGLRRSLGVLLAVTAALGAPTSASAPGVEDLLPNLRMLPLTQWHLVRTGKLGETRLLRFTSIIVNQGRGPLELRGERECSSISACPRMTTTQRIRRSDGTWRLLPTAAKQKYEVGDGHHHWHVIRMERFELYPLGATPGDPPLRGQKFGFCFFDERALNLALPGAPPTRIYPEYGDPPRPGCADAYSLRTRVGLSVGWGDAYPWNFGGQLIDTTGLPNGRYLVCATVDPVGRFLETREHDNQSWARIRITGDTLRVLRRGQSGCARHLSPPG